MFQRQLRSHLVRMSEIIQRQHLIGPCGQYSHRRRADCDADVAAEAVGRGEPKWKNIWEHSEARHCPKKTKSKR